MDMKLNIKHLTTYEQVDSILNEWDRLHEQCVYRTTFNSTAYLWTAIKRLLEENNTLFFIVVRDEKEEMIGLFPFYRGKLNWHKIFKFDFISQAGMNEEADKSYPLIKQGYEEIVWKCFADYLKENRKLWQIIYFYEFPEGLPGKEIIEKEFNTSQYRVRTSDGYTSPIVDLKETWEEFWGSHKKMRKRVRKMQNDYSDSFEFKIFHDKATVDNCIKEYFQLEGRSWKGKENPPVGIASTQKLREFYSEAYNKLADNNELVFGFLYCEQKLVSAEIAYICGDKVFFGQGCYDLDYKKHSPGMVSTALFLEYFFDKGYDYGDYLGGWAFYIEPWAARMMRSFNQDIFHYTFKMRLSLIFKTLFRWIKPIKKQKEVKAD